MYRHVDRCSPSAVTLARFALLVAVAIGSARAVSQPSQGPAPRSATPTGLTERYPFDGDASSAMNGPTGVFAGARAAADRAGREGGALEFSGEGAVVIHDNPHLPQASAPRTLALWVRAAPGTDWRMIATWGRTATRESFGLGLFENTAVVMAYYADVHGTRPVADGRWHHLAATYDGRVMRLFVDGVCEREQAFSLATRGRQLIVGRALLDHPATYALTGAVDDLQVYDRALGDAEIRALARRPGNG